MKNTNFPIYCLLAFFLCSVMIASAQCRGGSCSPGFSYKREGPQWAKNDKKQGKGIYLDSTYVYPDYQPEYEEEEDEEEQKRFTSWEKKGMEMYFGGGLYFGSKKTANYYNGAPGNAINLDLIFKNPNTYYRDELIFPIIREAYRYLGADGTIILVEDYNNNSTYNMAMNVAIGFKYRFHKNFYFDLSYSFRRLTCSNHFVFNFPDVLPGNKENPPYSKWQNIVAREDRHYIDLSVGYIFQKYMLKPFVALGAQFTYMRIKDFYAIFEDVPPIDLLRIARYPNSLPNQSEMPVYTDWAGPGYGFSLTAGIKIAFHPAVSLDPVFVISAASFGNNTKDYLTGFNTAFCFNYIVGVRLVLNDALFVKR